MPCLVALLALISPRLALFFVWLFSDMIDRAFEGWLLPLLGFFLLPWTTLAYTVMWDIGHAGRERLRVVHRGPRIPRGPRVVRGRSQISSPPATDAQAGLRREIRELGVLLGRTLVRQEGQELLDQVERIRHLIRADRDSAAALLAEVEPSEAIRLVRAFTTYFHLANVAEQVHRGRELAGIRARDGSWLSQAVDRIAAAEIPRSEMEAEVRRLGVRPVFTAHPTEAARRTVLYKLRQIAELLEGTDPRADGPPRGDGGPALADRRAAHREARRGGRGAQRGLVPRRPPRRRGAARAGGARRGAGPARPRAGAGRAATGLRHLDRRRPRRESERGAGCHRAASSISSTTTGCATRSRSSTCCAATSRRRSRSRARRRSYRGRSHATSNCCRRWSHASCG